MTKQCFYCSYLNKDDATIYISCGMELDKYWDNFGDKPILLMDAKRKTFNQQVVS